jgi:hypothetical protein
MLASRSFSITWLNVLALAAHNPVPRQAAAIVVKSIGAPAQRNPAPDVTTTKELNLNFARSLYNFNLLGAFRDPLTADSSCDNDLAIMLTVVGSLQILCFK